MSKLTIHAETDEPVIGILIPVRLLPQLMTLVVAATASEKPLVQTTGVAAEEAVRPGLRKTLPPNVRELPTRKAAG